LAAAAVTAAGAATIRFWPMIDTRHLDRTPAVYWPEPQLHAEPDPAVGPVVVTVAYTVAPDHEPQFLRAMRGVRRSRLRTGAVQWGVFRDGETAGRMVEVYVVP